MFAAAAMSCAAPAAAQTFSYSGPPVAIPDGADLSGNNPGAQVGAPITVSGVAEPVASLTMSIDGTTCSTIAGATTVGLDHSFVSDLQLTLEAPSGTQVLVINETDGSGNNFCQTVLDDASAGPPIQSVASGDAPFTGSFTPNAPLAGFTGEGANGNWTLLAQDFFAFDTGNIRAWTLNITQQVATTTTLASSLNPSNQGQSVTFTATVTAMSGTPTGNLTFTLDSTPQATVALDGTGQATFTTSTMTAGTHTMVADYLSDGVNAASTSAPLTQTVAAVAAATTATPTLGRLALLALAVALALLGAVGWRRRKRDT